MTRDFSKYQSHVDRKSVKGTVPDLRRGKKPAHSERMKQVYADKQTRNEGLNRTTMKTAIAAVILMGTVALGLGQDTQQRRATLTLLDAGPDSVTINVTAGSEGTPYGFLINWAQHGEGNHNVTFDGSRCHEYALPPFTSVAVTINGYSNTSCIINEDPWPVQCGQGIRFLGRLIGLGTAMNGFQTITDDCP